MANLSLAPGVWVSVFIDAEGGVVAAFHFDLSGHVMMRDIAGYSLWEPPSLLVTMT